MDQERFKLIDEERARKDQKRERRRREAKEREYESRCAWFLVRIKQALRAYREREQQREQERIDKEELERWEWIKRREEMRKKEEERYMEANKEYLEKQAATAAKENEIRLAEKRRQMWERRCARKKRLEYNDIVMHVISHSVEEDSEDAVHYEYDAHGFKFGPFFQYSCFDYHTFFPVMKP